MPFLMLALVLLAIQITSTSEQFYSAFVTTEFTITKDTAVIISQRTHQILSNAIHSSIEIG